MERGTVPWGWPCLCTCRSRSVSNGDGKSGRGPATSSTTQGKDLEIPGHETQKRRRRKIGAPKLQMHDPLHAVLRHIVVVEERVGYARDTEEKDAGGGEEERAEVGSLGGLGDGGVEGQKGCFLDRLISFFP